MKTLAKELDPVFSQFVNAEVCEIVSCLAESNEVAVAIRLKFGDDDCSYVQQLVLSAEGAARLVEGVTQVLMLCPRQRCSCQTDVLLSKGCQCGGV